MKRYGAFALAFVLCCCLFTGCRMGNSNMRPTNPTNEATTMTPTMPTVMPDTRPATEPATAAPTEQETATESMTAGTEDSTEDTQARKAPHRPGVR